MENVPHNYFLHSSEDKINIFGPTICRYRLHTEMWSFEGRCFLSACSLTWLEGN